MIGAERLRELMVETINESAQSVSEDHGIHPKVGAVLADENGHILARAHRGEFGGGNHAEYCLLKKVTEAGINLAETVLLVTLEPCTARGPGKIPCSKRIVESGISKVYIGMLDPNPVICGRGETYLRSKLSVERFPGDLIREIDILNTDFIGLYRTDQLPETSLYVSKSISEVVHSFLQRAGFDIDKDELPFGWDITIDDLIQYCRSGQSSEVLQDLAELVRKARGEAFDNKYADYKYDDDSRGLGDHWQREFRGIMKGLRALDYSQRRVINVGIGNGLEAPGLFDNVEHLTVVDIALKSLERAQQRLPRANAILAEAEDLRGVRTGSQDVYVSLRTYQSAYFGISPAIREAYRVVRQGGLVIISIANGFIGTGGALIPGLVIPRSNVVDRNRPFEIAELIRRKLTLLRFEEIGLRTGLDEIYVFGRRTR
jgi:pyrimidine deaminase RibD-like protein/SAM-dependent methyltransferase